MPLLLVLVLLLAASVLLTVEVVTGRSRPRTRTARWAAAGTFAGAASAGTGLLLALPWSEWVLMVALLPLTTICTVRFVSLARGHAPGWRIAVICGVVLATGTISVVEVLPYPLTRAAIQATVPGSPHPSVLPEAGRLVRT